MPSRSVGLGLFQSLLRLLVAFVLLSHVFAMAGHFAVALPLERLAGILPFPVGPPFRGLSDPPVVQTSNDDYSIWLNWSADDVRLDYGDGRPVIVGVGSVSASPWITLTCRAPSSPLGLAGAGLLGVTLSVPMHPEAPSLPLSPSPLYWWRALRGLEYVRLAVQLVLPGGVSGSATLVARTAHPSFSRPPWTVDLFPADVLDAVAHPGEFTVEVRGSGLDFVLNFPPAPELARPAALMVTHCV